MSIEKVASTVAAASSQPAPERARIDKPRVAAQSAQEPVKAAAAQAEPAEQIKAVVKQIESYLKSVGRSLEFSVDASSGKTVVSVRDTQTGALIRQIPNEEVLRMAQMADEQSVALIDEIV